MKSLKEASYNLSVLYVEDSLIMTEHFIKLLKRSFKNVVAVNNSEEALRIYKNDSFNLVITDMILQTVNGVSLIDAIRKIDDSQAIIVFSAHTDCEMLIKLINSGICGFIKKQTDIHEAYKTLTRVCSEIQTKLIMNYYHAELEKLLQEILAFECRPDCPMRDVLNRKPKEESVCVVEEPEFEFFEAPVVNVATAKQNEKSTYKDYFSFLQADDREELKDQLADIDLALLNAYDDEKSVNPEHIARLGSSFVRYANVLTHYHFFSDMGMAILELGQKIVDEREKIALQANDSKLYIGGFCSVLQTFMSEVWEKNSDNPKLFNDSIINDASTILNMIAPPKKDDNDHSLVFF